MMIKFATKVLLAGAVAVSFAGAAVAGASITSADGTVMVNSGIGYRHVDSGAQVKTGDRVMVGAKSSAMLKFDDGCSVPVKNGVITIGEKSPCVVKAQTREGASTFFTLGNIPTGAVVVGGVVILGGIVIGVIAATNDTGPTSP